MAKYNTKQVLQTMSDTAVVPVFYNGDIDVAKQVVKACYAGGIRAFEFTNRGPAALEVFKALVPFAQSECPGLIMGVGSISFGADARRFIKAGANFVVGPQYVPAVMRVCRCRRIPYMPGCGTVSEVGRAQRAGCQVCKVFPGDVLSPAFVKALRAPMPWSRIMVTGGVKPERENLEKWFNAGAEVVGMGSNLFPKDAIASADWQRITDLCSGALDVVKEVKNQK